MLGIGDKMRKALEKVELPDVLNIDLVELQNGFLTYTRAKDMVKEMTRYRAVVKGLPSYLAEFSRVSVNFCNHIIPELDDYISNMVSEDDFENYKENLKISLNEIVKVCSNSSVKKITKEKYESVLKKLGVAFGSSSSNLVGDVALALQNLAEKTAKMIEDKSTDSYGVPMLFKNLGIKNGSAAKRLLKKFIPTGLGRRISLAAKGAANSAVSGIKKKLASVLIKESLDPVEYYDFSDEKYLTISLVHTISRILSAYMDTLKSYPRGVKFYVKNCQRFIKVFLKKLDSYESYFKILKNSKKNISDKAVAKSSMRKVLHDMADLLGKNTAKENNSLFVLKEVTLGSSSRTDKYNDDRSVWISGNGTITNSDDKKIVIKGWSLGDFLLKMKKVFDESEENFEDFLTKNLEVKTNKSESLFSAVKSLLSDGHDESYYVKEITGVLKKAISLNEKVEKSYSKVSDLKIKSDSKNKIDDAYSEFKEDYNAIKTFVGDNSALNEAIRKIGFEGGLVLIDGKNSINKVIFTLPSIISQIKYSGKETVWELILNHCVDCFKYISSKAKDLLETHEQLRKYHSNKSKSDRKISPEGTTSKTNTNRLAIPELRRRLGLALEECKTGKNDYDRIKNAMSKKSALGAYVEAYDKSKNTKEVDNYKTMLKECEECFSSLNKEYEALLNAEVYKSDQHKGTIALFKGLNKDGFLDKTAIDALALDANKEAKKKIENYLADMDSAQKEFNKKFAELKSWEEKMRKLMNDSAKTPIVSANLNGSTPEGPVVTPGGETADDFIEKINSTVRSLKNMLDKKSNLEAYAAQFGFGKVRTTDHEKIIKEDAGGKELWKEAKSYYEKCDDYIDKSKKWLKKLYDIKVKGSDDKKRNLLDKKTTMVDKEISSIDGNDKAKKEIETIIGTVESLIKSFNDAFGILGDKLEKMNEKISNFQKNRAKK